MIYFKRPKDFNEKFEVVSCFLENDGNFLLLFRNSQKSEGSKWGVPAGKLEFGENIFTAIQREVFEETGNLFLIEKFTYFKKVYIKYKEYDFIYHIFNLKTYGEISIKINKDEHNSYAWVSPIESLKYDLIKEQDKCIKLYYKIN